MQKYYLALDIGGTKIAGAILALESESALATPPQVRLLEERPTAASEGGARVCARVCEFASELLAHAREQGWEVSGCGVSSAGVVDSRQGSIVSATSIMPGWAGTPLGQKLAQATGLDVRVLNDVHAHALGEMHFGAGSGHRDALVLAVGTGIGGAVIADGKLVLGARGLAGHLGHTTYLGGPYLPCSCGREGHIEAIASGSGVTNLHNLLVRERLASGQQGVLEADNGFEVYQRSLNGDEIALEALTLSARALGQAIGNLANCFDPALIILSGSMTRSGELWWTSLAEGYAQQAMNLVAGVPLIEGKLGGNAPLFGALAFALNPEE